jgi:hypothetical protein
MPLGTLGSAAQAGGRGGCENVVESDDDPMAGAASSRKQIGCVRGGQRARLVE